MKKLDSKSLMLGDWVRLRYKRSDMAEVVKDFQVSELRRFYKECPDVEAWSKESGNMGDVERLEPIIITPEILEKNGFKKYGDTGWWLEDDYYDVQMYEWSDSIWVARYESNEMDCPHEQLTMSYIHELQHFLKAVGIDKEMTI